MKQLNYYLKLFGTKCLNNTACSLQIKRLNLDENPVNSLDERLV